VIYIGIIWKINNISESQYSLLFSLLSQHDGLFLQRTNNKLNINIFIETDKGKLSILKTSFESISHHQYYIYLHYQIKIFLPL